MLEDFDLVRLYHPDKASDVSPDVAHQRFQVITHSYDVLRGKKASGTVDHEQVNPSVDLRYQTTAAWRARHRRRSEELYKSGAADDKWKDRLILAGVIGVSFRSSFTFACVLISICIDRVIRDCEYVYDAEGGNGGGI